MPSISVNCLAFLSLGRSLGETPHSCSYHRLVQSCICTSTFSASKFQSFQSFQSFQVSKFLTYLIKTMDTPGAMFILVQVGYCMVYFHTVGLTPGFTYLVSCDDSGMGFSLPVMVYQAPVARFRVDSPISIGQLMGLRFFPTMAAIPSLPTHRSREVWSPPTGTPHPPIRPALPASAPGLGWSWSSPATVAPPQVIVCYYY